MYPQKKPSQSTLSQLAPYAGMGLQLAASMTAFGALGWWLDDRLGSKPWLLLVGVILGATGGMISVIRTAIRSSGGKAGNSRR